MRKFIETVEAWGADTTTAGGSLLQAAPLAAASLPGLHRLALNLPRKDLPSPATQESGEGLGVRAYVAAVEYWFETAPEDPVAAIAAVSSAAGQFERLRRSLYRVSERIQLDDGIPTIHGQPKPGVKAFYIVRRPDGLSNDDATRGWREHAGTARKHHAAMSRYVQNGVIEALTPGAAVIHGIAELSFPTLEDFQQRMYDSDEGREAVTREASALVSQVTTLYTTEYVFPGPAQ